jgi:two-component system, OmpR family, sensor histidine kinase ChvG
VSICVRDQGPVIAEAHLPRLFERFFTTDADRSGTGLGFSIVKSVVDGLSGTVTVQSQPGQGARFCMRLPARAVSGSRIRQKRA